MCVVANEDYSDAGVDKVPHAVNDGKVFAEDARRPRAPHAEDVDVFAPRRSRARVRVSKGHGRSGRR